MVVYRLIISLVWHIGSFEVFRRVDAKVWARKLRVGVVLGLWFQIWVLQVRFGMIMIGRDSFVRATSSYRRVTSHGDQPFRSALAVGSDAGRRDDSRRWVVLWRRFGGVTTGRELNQFFKMVRKISSKLLMFSSATKDVFWLYKLLNSRPFSCTSIQLVFRGGSHWRKSIR